MERFRSLSSRGTGAVMSELAEDTLRSDCIGADAKPVGQNGIDDRHTRWTAGDAFAGHEPHHPH